MKKDLIESGQKTGPYSITAEPITKITKTKKKTGKKIKGKKGSTDSDKSIDTETIVTTQKKLVGIKLNISPWYPRIY